MSDTMERAIPEQSQGWLNTEEVGDVEKWASVLGGGALALFGLSRRSLLGLALAAGGGYVVYRSLTGHAPVREGLGMVISQHARPVAVEAAITINKPIGEVYAFWRDPENLPQVIEALEEVKVTGEGRSHWTSAPILGTQMSWDADVVEDRENEHIIWRSAPGAELSNRVEVRLKEVPGDRGVETRLRVELSPPGGAVGAAVARLLKRLTVEQVKQDLRHAKQLLETGEITTVTGQTTGQAGIAAAR